jgi:hypothetical protein
MGDAIEACEVCGYVWDAVTATDAAVRARASTEAFAALLEAHPEASLVRPSADRWSALEYGCHTRDVLYNLRDRIVLGIVEDNPRPHALHGTPRVDGGLYADDTPASLATDLRAAGELFARTLDRMPRDAFDRPIHYSWPREATRTLRWVASQAVHECEHHLDDARENVSGDQSTAARLI